MELVAKLRAIVPDPGCIYEAIEPILANCESPEDITTRTQIAVKLALCEFSAANVAFPNVCRDPSRLTECTRQLESKSTWWTTFSGQYRHISLVCKEHQPLFASKKVVNVFHDAYDVYMQHKDQFSAELVQLQQLKDETTHILQSVTADLASTLAAIQAQTRDLVVETNSGHINAVKLNQALELSLQTTQAQSSRLSNLSTVFATQMSSFDHQVALFTNSMTDLRSKHELTAQMLSRSANHTTQVLKHADQTLTESAAILRAIGKIFTFFGMFVGPLGLIAIFVGVVWFVCKTQRTKSVDILFF